MESFMMLIIVSNQLEILVPRIVKFDFLRVHQTW
jgi:hypothetical protein